MSVLNQLFNRGFLGSKCKTCLNLVLSRIKLVQNKRDLQLRRMKKEISQYLQSGQESIARIRVEHFIREQNLWHAYEILELFCEFVLARIPIIESQRDCPMELRESISSIIFAASRCSDLPDLENIRSLLMTKYGKEFVSYATELRPGSSVNRSMIEKLSISTPTPESKLKALQGIAREYNVHWESHHTEAELRRKHDDLLDVSKVHRASGISSNGAAPLPAVGTDETKEAVISERFLGNSDRTGIMEKVRNVIATAERASAAARAAAELVNSDFRS